MSILEKLKNNFLEDYTKLNETFNLVNPLEAFYLYCYMLHNGYLSVTHEFEYKASNTDTDYNSIILQVLTGSGVCRNITSLLTEVLLHLDMDSTSIGCMLYGKTYVVRSDNNPKYTKDELLRWIDFYVTNETKRQELRDVIAKYGNKIKISIDYSSSADQDGNHIITWSKYDNKNIFLDPTSKKVYFLDRDNEPYLYSEDLSKIEIFLILDIVNSRVNRDISRILSNNISIEEVKKVKEDIDKLIDNNKDIIFKFYKKHQLLYKEVDYVLKRRK